MRRRDFLTALGTATTATIAGCITRTTRPDAEIGDATTIGQHTFTVPTYQRRETIATQTDPNPPERHVVTLNILNTANQRTALNTLLDTITLEDGRNTYQPAATPQPAYSGTLLPGELVTITNEYPLAATTTDTPYPNPVTLTIDDKPAIRLHDPNADDINGNRPRVTLNHSIPRTALSTLPLTTGGARIEPADDTIHAAPQNTTNETTFIPPIPNDRTLTITNTTDTQLTIPDNGLIIKQRDGTERRATALDTTLADPLQPNETRQLTINRRTAYPYLTTRAGPYLAINLANAQKHLLPL